MKRFYIGILSGLAALACAGPAVAHGGIAAGAAAMYVILFALFTLGASLGVLICWLISRKSGSKRAWWLFPVITLLPLAALFGSLWYSRLP